MKPPSSPMPGTVFKIGQGTFTVTRAGGGVASGYFLPDQAPPVKPVDHKEFMYMVLELRKMVRELRQPII